MRAFLRNALDTVAILLSVFGLPLLVYLWGP